MFNIQIFVRGKGNIKFTNQGELLVEYARESRNRLQKLENELSNLSDKVCGKLRIATSNNFATYELPNILKRYSAIYPNVQFEVFTGWSIKVLESLQEGDCHIGIVRGGYEWNDSKILINEDPYCLVSKNEIDLKDLPNLPLVRHKTDPDASKVVNLWWDENYSKPPYVSMKVDKVETCKEMVMNGFGYGFMPAYLLKNLDKSNPPFIHTLTNPDASPVLRKLWAYYYEADTKLNAVKTFTDFLKKHYEL